MKPLTELDYIFIYKCWCGRFFDEETLAMLIDGEKGDVRDIVMEVCCWDDSLKREGVELIIDQISAMSVVGGGGAADDSDCVRNPL